MKWPLLKGSYRLINDNGDIAIVTRASFDLQDDKKFDECHRIAVIGSCVTENIGIDRMIKNIITNGKIRGIVVCGEESRGHDVGNALINLINKGVVNGRIIDATGSDPALKVSDELIKRFREQIVNIKLINSVNPDEIIKVVESMPLTDRLNDYQLKINDEKIDFSNTINADGTSIEWEPDNKGMFRINVSNNRIIVKHFYNNEEHVVITGTKAKFIYKKLVELKLIENIHHALWLGSELRWAEHCLITGDDYIEDDDEKFSFAFIKAKNLSEAWIKALTRVFINGKEIFVGKYNTKTLDLPVMIHIDNITNKPLIHESAPRFDYKDTYAKEFINGSDKENEFVYTYYSRLRHYKSTPAVMKARNVMSNEAISGEVIEVDQVSEAIRLLKKDPTLRRVVMSTWMPYKDLSLERGPHAPCLVIIQLRIIDNKLNFYVTFKSQDLYSAFPSNAYALMRLQEYMAKELNVKPGSYTHVTNSMHIYDSVIDSVRDLLVKENKI